MALKSNRARFYSILEIATLVVGLLLYWFVYRPKEKRDSEWNRIFNDGQAALHQGNFSDARKDFKALLVLAEDQRRGTLAVATVQDRLADAERGLGNYQEAFELDELAQPVFAKYQGRREGPYAEFLLKLSGTAWQAGHYAEAETAGKQGLALQERIFGFNNVQLVPALNWLIYFYYDRDQDPIAETFAKRSLTICQSHLGTKHPATAYARSMLSLVYDGEGRFAEAERLARSALPTLESAAHFQGDNGLSSTFNRLGLALDGERKWPQAEAAFTKALVIREKLSGAESGDLVVILRNLARLYAEEGRTSEANAFRQRADSILASHKKMAAPLRLDGLNQQPKPMDNQQSGAPLDRRPLTGSIVGRTYTNEFFDFSIEFPKNWVVVWVNQGPAEDAKAIAYFLLLVGSRDKQMHGTRWILVTAARPRDSSLSARSAQKALENQANALNLVLSMGLGKDFRPVGKPDDVLLGGRRMTRLHVAAKVDIRGAKYDTRGAELALVEHGYMLIFVTSDPVGRESEDGSAAKALDSLRFFGGSHAAR